MVVIAVMPAAGLMISIGKMIAMFSGDFQLLLTTAGVIEDLGWAVIVNLHILFAVAIGGSWAKERAGGAFAALLAFILINRTTGKLFAVTGDMLATDGATTKTLFGQDILVNGYFTNVLGAPALNMGVFVGIIAGFVGAVIFNKYYNYRKLPDALSFFNGKRFVPFVVIGWSVLISLVLAIIWPVVQTGINNFGIWIADSADTAPILAGMMICGYWTKIVKLVDTALSCSDIYGTIPTTAMIVTTPPRSALLPYLDATKSASDVMRFCFEMRRILRITIHHSAIISVGPI